MSRKTVSNRLHEISLFARNQQKKPVISKENIAARLALVSKHVLWPENRPSKVTKVNYYFWVRMETTICMDVSSRCYVLSNGTRIRDMDWLAQGPDGNPIESM